MNVTITHVLMLYNVHSDIYCIVPHLWLLLLSFFMYLLFTFTFSIFQNFNPIYNMFLTFQTLPPNMRIKTKQKNLIIYRRYMFTKLFIELIWGKHTWNSDVGSVCLWTFNASFILLFMLCLRSILMLNQNLIEIFQSEILPCVRWTSI